MNQAFENVSQEKAFWVSDGRYVRNIYELVQVFEDMKEKTFKYHVNKKKNDFSEWIRQVIGDEKLADKVARLVMKDKIQIVLQKHLIKKLNENDNNTIQ
ncbi:MAG: DUF5752 family protein [archaeon]